MAHKDELPAFKSRSQWWFKHVDLDQRIDEKEAGPRDDQDRRVV